MPAEQENCTFDNNYAKEAASSENTISQFVNENNENFATRDLGFYAEDKCVSKTKYFHTKDDNRPTFPTCDRNDSKCNLPTEWTTSANIGERVNSFYIKQCHRKTTLELNSMSLKALRLLSEELARTVKEASSELVSLLQNNDTLQQESEARNVAIEQLLKLAVNRKQSEAELRPNNKAIVAADCNDCNEDSWD